MRYAVVTPARNEAENLRRLAAALAAQTVPPQSGSSSTTARPTGRSSSPASSPSGTTGSASCRSRERRRPNAARRSSGRSRRGSRRCRDPPDVVVKVDADISFEPDYFERLLARFAADPALGIASGSAFELERRVARRHVTGTTVWGASRAYRWDCLQDVLPLEERMAWDGVDEFKANARGWHTTTFEDLPFRHHRPEGERDGAPGGRARTRAGGPLPRLPALVSRPAFALAGSPRARGARDDLGLRAGRAGAGAALGTRPRARTSAAAEHPPVAAQSSEAAGRRRLAPGVD